MERYDRAITINGLIKNRDRHEKDDRAERNDPSRYVMGWNNDRKKEALQHRRSQLLSDLEQAGEAFQRAENKNTRLQNQVFAIKRILEHPGYKILNTPGIQRSIRSVEEQMTKLKKSSDQLKALTAQLEKTRGQITLGEAARDGFIGKISLWNNELQQMDSERLGLKPLLDLLTGSDKDQLLHFQQQT